MQQSEYLSIFFVCQKPLSDDEIEDIDDIEEFQNGNDKINDTNGHH